MSATFVNQAFCEDCQTEGNERQKQKPCKITQETLLSQGIKLGKACPECNHPVGSHPNQAVQTAILAAQAKAQAESQTQGTSGQSATGSGGINMKELGDTLVKAIVVGNLKANEAVRKINEDSSSMASASNLKKHHTYEIRARTEHKYFDFLEDVSISDELKQCAEDLITQLWSADEKPDWFAESVWEKMSSNTMSETWNRLLQSQETDEYQYEYLINFVVNCACEALTRNGKKHVALPSYAGNRGGKPAINTIEGTLCYAAGCKSAVADGLVKKDILDLYGIPIEAKPAFTKQEPYDADELRSQHMCQALCQIEGCQALEKKYCVGVLSCWTHWVFVKVIRCETAEEKVQVQYVTLEFNGNDAVKALKQATINIIKLIMLDELDSNTRSISKDQNIYGQTMQTIGEEEIMGEEFMGVQKPRSTTKGSGGEEGTDDSNPAPAPVESYGAGTPVSSSNLQNRNRTTDRQLFPEFATSIEDTTYFLKKPKAWSLLLSEVLSPDLPPRKKAVSSWSEDVMGSDAPGPDYVASYIPLEKFAGRTKADPQLV